jgi:hypothetical protein
MRISATVHAPWPTALGRLVRTLREKGFEVRRTFDLQLARQLLRSSETEPCPHHGTAPCSCQYLIAQINDPGEGFSAVVIHGHDDITTVSLLAGTDEEMKRDMATASDETLQHLQTVRDAAHRTDGHGASDSTSHRYATSGQFERRRRENP